MTDFNTPNDIYSYVSETVQELNNADLKEAATLLENINQTAFTTGSEWLGELGLIINSIQANYSIPTKIQNRMNALMKKVNEVWPSI